MPTVTKKMAPNRSRTGSISGTMRRRSGASATTAPAMNAPRATLKPVLVASSEAVKHTPSTVMSSISLFLKRPT